MVSRTAATTTSAVSTRPDHPGGRLEPGQSCHQKAIIATAGRAKVTSGPSTSAERSGPSAPTASRTATGTTNSRPTSPRPGWRATHRAISGEEPGRVHDELGAHRQLAHPAPGRVVDGVGDRRGRPDLADLADTLHAEGIHHLVDDVHEVDRHFGGVGVDRDQVLAQVVG